MIAQTLTRGQAVTADRSVHELHTAAERARADGRRRYANELDDLADQLAQLIEHLWPRR